MKEYNEKSVLVLQERLNILKKNDDNLSIEDIQGRYANAYKRLRSEIAEHIYNTVHVILTYGWKFLEQDKEAEEVIKAEAHKYIDKKCFGENEKKALLTIAFSSYDADLVLRQAELLAENIELNYYYVYWKQRCLTQEYLKFQMNPKYEFYNPVEDVFWDKTLKLWTNNRDGKSYFMPGLLAPDYETNYEFYKKCIEVDKQKVDAFWDEHNKSKGKIILMDLPEISTSGILVQAVG